MLVICRRAFHHLCLVCSNIGCKNSACPFVPTSSGYTVCSLLCSWYIFLSPSSVNFQHVQSGLYPAYFYCIWLSLRHRPPRVHPVIGCHAHSVAVCPDCIAYCGLPCPLWHEVTGIQQLINIILESLNNPVLFYTWSAAVPAIATPIESIHSKAVGLLRGMVGPISAAHTSAWLN